MEQNKMTWQEKERLVQLLTTKFSVDEMHELITLLKKDKCQVEILPVQNVNNQRELLVGLLGMLEKEGGNKFIDKAEIVAKYEANL